MFQRVVAAVVMMFFATALSGTASAEIITDRPDVAESSRTVGAGHFQVETGIDRSHADPNTGTRFPTKLRVGIIEPLELHLESDIFGFDRTETPAGAVDTSGFTALDVGGKLHIWEGDGNAASVGTLVALTVPTGGELSQDGLGLTALLAADFDLVGPLGLGTNVGVALPISADGLITGLYAVAVGIGVPPLPALGFFAEVFGGLNSDAFSMSVDGGLTYLLTPTIQLDAYVRTGLVNDATDIGYGAGLSVKL